MSQSIPFNDLRAQYRALQQEIDSAVQRVLDSGWYILGDEVTAFEDDFAAYCGAAGAVGVNSGTDALQLALAALKIGPGHEVITVAHTAVATVAAIRLTGATPVLVDVDPHRYTLDPAALPAALTPRTRAIVPVHIYGRPADMNAICAFAEEHNLFIVEDCAQAHGATYRGHPVGTMGQAGCFSFYPTKNLGALGDGGAVISTDSALLDQVRLLREYGWTPAARYVSSSEGMNSRLDELQAAILRVKLPRLDEWNDRRRAIAQQYNQALTNLVHVPTASDDDHHVYHLYVIRTRRRDALRAALTDRGIGTGIHYPAPVHRQPAYGWLNAHLPVTEALAGEILSLPLHPFLRDDTIEAVIAAVGDAMPTVTG